jgi:hypothetical protein
MVISYSQDGSVVEAVTKTFDGSHQCNLCKSIAKGKKSEKKSEYKFEAAKLKFSNASVPIVLNSPSAFWEVRPKNDPANVLTHAPPAPPPRTLHS